MQDAEVAGLAILDTNRVLSEVAPAQEPATPNHRIAITQALSTQSIHDFESTCKEVNINHCIGTESGDSFTAILDLARHHFLKVIGLSSVLLPQNELLHNGGIQHFQCLKVVLTTKTPKFVPFFSYYQTHKSLRRVSK